MKYLVIVAFLAILASLGSALYFMMKDGRDGKAKTSSMARAMSSFAFVRCVICPSQSPVSTEAKAPPLVYLRRCPDSVSTDRRKLPI